METVIDVWHLFLCSSLLFLVIAASFWLKLGLERRIIVAAVRCAVQLMTLCAFILQPMFDTNSLPVIVAYLFLMLLLAAREASSRLTYAYDGMLRDFIYAYVMGAGSVVAFAIFVILQLDPWWDAKYAVPISGMLIGNVLTSTALGANTYLTELAEGTDRIELCLVRGASWREASLPATRKALTAALTPTLSSMSVMGLVMMPGMMTGQMLGGTPPLQAGAYQLMIMYLIAVAGCLSSTLTILLATLRCFDAKEHCLLRYKLVKREKSAKTDILIAACRFIASANLFGKRKKKQGYDSLNDVEAPVKEEAPPTLTITTASSGKVHLEASGVVCSTTGLAFSLSLKRGSRTSVTGATGAGKTQLLKAVARVLADPKGTLRLNGAVLEAPAWRGKVGYVSQDRPTISGTPREFFTEAKQFAGQRNKSSGDPVLLAGKWGLDSSKFDRPWFELSGGEAQRCSLAIALALRPEVLLLDEPTSACDEATAKLIEQDLLDLTILIVTHSKVQAQRLCTDHIVIHPPTGN